jgi:hypothetical protein
MAAELSNAGLTKAGGWNVDAGDLLKNKGATATTAPVGFKVGKDKTSEGSAGSLEEYRHQQ